LIRGEKAFKPLWPAGPPAAKGQSFTRMNMNARAATKPRHTRLAALLLAGLSLAGCETARNATAALTGGTTTPAGTPGFVRGFLGGVAAEEPVAATIARDVLSAGGNAADAAVAAGFAMAVTLPSRVGLGAIPPSCLTGRRRSLIPTDPPDDRPPRDRASPA